MSTQSHLHPSALGLLKLSDKERIEHILSDRWIGYSQATQILEKLEDLFLYPPSIRMPNILIVGDTNNGKTTLIKRFRSKHPATDNPDGNAISAPVVFVEAPEVPDRDQFYMSILNALFAPFRPSDKIAVKKAQVEAELKEIGTKVLLIDEFHHLLSGPPAKMSAILNAIKSLGNSLNVSIAASGLPAALRTIQSDPQLSNRFEPVMLPLWRDDNEFKRLLVSFEATLPLRNPSRLAEAKMATRLHTMASGLIGELSNLLKSAGKHAIRSGIEKINGKVLDEIGWHSPNERKRIIDRGY